MKTIKKALKKKELKALSNQLIEDNFNLISENRELQRDLVLCRFDVINAKKSLKSAEKALNYKEMQFKFVAQHTSEILRCTHELTKD